MEISKAFGIFDSLVSPVALYNCELYIPYIIPKRNFISLANLLRFWEDFEPESINPKICRIVLSLNKK